MAHLTLHISVNIIVVVSISVVGTLSGRYLLMLFRKPRRSLPLAAISVGLGLLLWVYPGYSSDGGDLTVTVSPSANLSLFSSDNSDHSDYSGTSERNTSGNSDYSGTSERNYNFISDYSGTSERNYHFIVFLIPTMPNEVSHRQLLRSTWMNISAWPEEEFSGVDRKFLNFKTMFVVGRIQGKEHSPEFLAEKSEHDDIFTVDYLFEEAGVLKYKVLWGMFRSLLLYNFSYLVKVDMDTLVILPDLLKGLSERPSDRMVYSGTCYGILPHRYVDKFKPELTVNYRNHRYCFGGGYFLSRDLIQHIAELDSSVYITVADPEDWFVGWLVYHVTRKLGINTNEVQLEKKKDGYVKNERSSRYNFDGTWFLHFLRTPKKLTDAFNCRISMVIEDCPQKQYWHYDNGTCTCFNILM